MKCKNSERAFKKEVKRIDRILEGIRNYNPYDLRFRLSKDYFRDFVYYALDECYKAKEIIEKSKVKEMHEKPHPLLARHFGIQTRGSKDIGFYKGNLDMLRNIVLDTLFNSAFNFNFEGKGRINEKVKALLTFEDPLTKETLQEKLERFGLDESHLEKYIEGKIMEYGQRIVAVVNKMEELGSLGQYEFGLLERFVDYFDKLKKLKLRFDPRGEYVFGQEGKPLSLDDIEEKARDYALHGLNLIVKNLQNRPVIEDQKSIYSFLFDNDGLKELKHIKKSLEKKTEQNQSGLYLAGNGLVLPLKEKILKDYEIIESAKEKFKEVLERKQSDLESKAREFAENANKEYKVYLEEFMNLTRRYSELLEEEEEDIAYALGISEPDYFIMINEKTKEEVLANYCLPLYQMYKQLNGASLARFVLDVKKSYIKAKGKKN